MKLHELKIHNIASIADASIHFNESPLKDESLFLICGPTGAGKSTILDAICLALYDDTPRLNTASRKDKFSPDGNDKTLTLQDPRQLLRRGANEGSISLSFEGNQGDLYHSSWSVRLNRNGNLNKSEWVLENVTQNQTYIKKDEISSEIVRAIGVEFADFQRTSMLAQGQFSQFLKSDDSTKADILQNLTGKENYERIGRKIYEITKAKEKELDDKKLIIDSQHILSDEERSKIIDELYNKGLSLKELNDEKTLLEKKSAWVRNWNKIINQLENDKKELSQYDEKISSDSYKNESQTITHWNESATAIEWQKLLHNSERSLQDVTSQEERLKERFSVMCSGINGLIEKTNDESRQLDAIKKRMEQRTKQEITMLENANVIIADLKRANEAHVKSLESEKAIKATEELIEKHDTEVKNAEKRHKAELEKTNQLQEQINRLAKEIKEADPDGTLLQQQENILAISTILDSMIALRDSLFNAEKELKTNQESYQNLQKKIDTLNTEEKRAKEEYSIAKEVYETAEKAVKDIAKELRSTLKEGDVCPVCGQKVTSLFSDEHFQSSLSQQLTNKTQKEKIWENYNTELNKANSEKTVLEDTIHKKQDELGKIRLQLIEKINNPILQDSDFKHETEFYFQADSLESMISEIKERKSQISGLTKRLTELQKQKEDVQKQKDQQKAIEEKEEQRYEDEQKRLTQLNHQKEKDVNLCDQYKKTEGDILTKMEELLTLPDWETAYKTDFQSLIDEILRLSTQYNEEKEKGKMLENQLRVDKGELEQVNERKETILNAVQWTEETSESKRMDHLLGACTRLSDEVTQWKTELGKIKTDITTYQKNLSTFYSTHPDIDEARLTDLSTHYTQDSITKMSADHQEITKMYATLTGKCNSSTGEMEKLKSEKPTFNEGEADYQEEHFLAQIQEKSQMIGSLNQEIGGLKDRLKSDKENEEKVKKLCEEYEESRKVFERWNRLNQEFGSADGSKFKKVALSFVLDVLLQNANRYLCQFDDHFELSKQGDYTIVIHDYRNDSNLSSSGLSGGQQFMVSLALALGLADMAENSHSVSDTLFIDEGFGTLSDEFLANVMDCLEKLHQSTGKKVGIISHVDSLRERIATQIVVHQGKGVQASTIELKAW
ncbi:MAG: AAA family ATPase [Paludibacteraceae bacterium]|nr:AAA family ATPase [Paludibacteraceae bacterium]